MYYKFKPLIFLGLSATDEDEYQSHGWLCGSAGGKKVGKLVFVHIFAFILLDKTGVKAGWDVCESAVADQVLAQWWELKKNFN